MQWKFSLRFNNSNKHNYLQQQIKQQQAAGNSRLCAVPIAIIIIAVIAVPPSPAPSTLQLHTYTISTIIL